MSESTVGSFDYYFDVADLMEKIGADFALVAKHPGTTKAIVISNVMDPRVAKGMIVAVDNEFRARFTPPEDLGAGQTFPDEE